MDKLPNPFCFEEEDRFVLDELLLLADMTEPLPLFLTSPTRAFLMGCGLEPVLDILDAH